MISLVKKVVHKFFLCAESFENVQFYTLDERKPAAGGIVHHVQLVNEKLDRGNAAVLDEPPYAIVVDEVRNGGQMGRIV